MTSIGRKTRSSTIYGNVESSYLERGGSNAASKKRINSANITSLNTRKRSKGRSRNEVQSSSQLEGEEINSASDTAVMDHLEGENGHTHLDREPLEKPVPCSLTDAPQNREHGTMSERRRISEQNSLQNVQVPIAPVIRSTTLAATSSMEVTNTDPVTRNSYKAQLMEALRDKRAYASAYVTLKEKSDKQQQLIVRQEQQILAMEASKKRVNRGDGRVVKRNEFSQSLQNSPLSDYLGICMSLPLFINKEAFLVVTESTFGPHGGLQIRDWTGSAVKVSKNNAEKAKLFVRFTCGNFGVPTCAMTRALSGSFYTNRFTSTSKFIDATARKVLESPIGKGMSDEQKQDCRKKLSVHGPTVSKFRKALREASNNRKQSCKSKYLKMLGYDFAAQSKPKNNVEKRKLIEKETQLARSRIFKILSDGEPDTTNWRLSSYPSVCNDGNTKTIGRMRNAMNNEGDNERNRTDILFLNEAARNAFNEFRGYTVPLDSSDGSDDASILSLARADAWITTAMKHLCLEGKGGRRNNGFVETFEALIGKAMERIIDDIWEDIKVLASHELAVGIDDYDDDSDPYSNNIRDWTVVLQSPDDNYLYLLASPTYFVQHVCFWYGKVVDCQIGRCKVGGVEFSKINTKLDFQQHEDSDIEDNNISEQEGNGLPVENLPSQSHME